MVAGVSDDTTRWAAQARHFETNVHFNKAAGLRVERWDDQQVVMVMPHEEWKCNSTTGFHGGVIAALADTCGTAASLAAIGGTGFIATVPMQINYLSVADSTVTSPACDQAGQAHPGVRGEDTDAAGKLVRVGDRESMQP